MRREFERSIPIYAQILGLLGILMLSMIPVGIFASGKIVLGIAILILCLLLMLPAFRHLMKRRGRPSMSPLIGAGVRGKLADAIGPRAEQLNNAAIDLEQISIILNRTKPEGLAVRDLIIASEARMRRMVELTVGAPANYMLSREDADVQIDNDGTWLAETRRLTEKLLAGAKGEEAGPLRDNLAELITAREEALRELNVRG